MDKQIFTSKYQIVSNKKFLIRLKTLSQYILILSIFIFLTINRESEKFASTFFSDSELKFFNSRLSIEAKNIAEKVLRSEKKVFITVIDILNNETQFLEERGELLEEEFTDLLYEKIPEQVIPYFEIVSLRLEWRNRFPESENDVITEEIAKLSRADWLLTGNYKKNFDSLTLTLQLIDIREWRVIWETVIKNSISDDFEENKISKIVTKKEILESKQTEVEKFDQESPFSNPIEVNPDIGFYLEDDSKLSAYAFTEKNEKEILKFPDGMVKVPEGEFLMGSELGFEDELPDHLVFIKSFFIDKHEVTNFEFSKCLICERGNGGFDSLEHDKPVVYVDWYNAYKFCESQNKRLPTEAEWEYAAKSGVNEVSFGKDPRLLQSFAWIEKNTSDVDIWGAQKVGSKKANQWGIFDLQGNVMEWVQNYYAPDYFSSVRQQKNPKGPLTPIDEKYPLRVARGGAWGGLNNAGSVEGVRVSKRYAFVEWTRSFQIGFRCAMDINQKNGRSELE